MIKAFIAVALVASAAPALMPVTSSVQLPTRHQAKVRTFKALLRQTELPPDVADATHAVISVAGCRRTSYGFRCRGSLSPVDFSGIPGSTCQYLVRIHPKTTHLVESGCE